MRPLSSRSDLSDLPPDLRAVVEASLQRWVESGVLYDPDEEEVVILVEPGDTDDGLIGYSGALSALRDEHGAPPFEWVTDEACCFEAGMIVGDDGSGFSLIVPKAPGISVRLLDACARQAAQASSAS